MWPATLFAALNDLGRDNGIGRLDLVENRFVGMKSRGVYETPGGTILHAAHRAMESITLDRGAAHLKDELMPRYAELIYNGFWFSPEREMLQALIDKSQENVTGEVRLKLYKGNVIVTGRLEPEIALFGRPRHLRGRPRRLRPEGRRGLHPAQRAAAAHAGRAQAAELNTQPTKSPGDVPGVFLLAQESRRLRRVFGCDASSRRWPWPCGRSPADRRLPSSSRRWRPCFRRSRHPGRQPCALRKLAVDASAVALSRRFLLPTP